MNKYWTYDKGSPIIPGLDCQVNAMIIIGDGKFDSNTHTYPRNEAAARLQSQGILTFTVGYGKAVTKDVLRLDKCLKILLLQEEHTKNQVEQLLSKVFLLPKHLQI